MGQLMALPNIGKEVERQLISVGINTPDELRTVGAEDAWLRIKAVDPSACMNRLLGLEGAVRGIKKAMLEEARKDELRAFYRANKG